MIQLGHHFADSRGSRHADARRQREWFIKARQNTQRKDEIADRLDDQFLTFASAAVVATEMQIKQFERRLDQYEAKLDAYESQLDAQDIAITKALIENRQILEAIEQRLAAVDLKLLEMLGGAFVLDDGRRVFKSEDGSYVVDEFGNEVSHDEVDFDLVTGATTAEDYLERMANRQELIDTHSATLEEREELHKAQVGIDTARDKISVARDKIAAGRASIEDGDLTVQEIEKLDADLLEAMPTKLPRLPSSAMKHLSGIDTAASVPNVERAFKANTEHKLTHADQAADPAFQFDHN